MAAHRGCVGAQGCIVVVGVVSELGKLLLFPFVGHNAEEMRKHRDTAAVQESDLLEMWLVAVGSVEVEVEVKLLVTQGIDSGCREFEAVVGM